MIPFFKIESSNYSHIQIIPDISVENGLKNIKLIQSIYSTIYKDLFSRISFKNGKIIYTKKQYISYYIVFTNNKISFHMCLPSETIDFISNRYIQTFPNITILSSNNPLDILNLNRTTQFNLIQKEENFKSLNCDMRSENPIPALLSISKDIKENDIVIFEINLSTLDEFAKELLENQKLKYVKSTNKFPNKTIVDKIFSIIPITLDVIFAIFDILFSMKNNDDSISKKPSFSSYTNQKITYDLFDAMIRVFVQSNDLVKQEQIGKSIEVCLRDISGDNELMIGKKLQPKNTKVKFNYVKNIYSAKEIAVFMQLPTRYYQQEYSIIESIDTKEMNLPKQLFENGIPIGEVKYKGVVKTASWNIKDKDVTSLPLAIFGMQGAGKSEYITNYAISCVENNQSLFVLDGIKNCELSENIINNLPENFNKICILDFSDTDYIFGLNWDEIKNSKIDNKSKMYISNQITQQLILFLDSLVDDNVQKLSPRMKRFLTSAGLLVFSLPNTTILDVLNCLIDIDKRHKFIKQSKLTKNSKIVQDLNMLDKNGDTNIPDVKGIIDRLDLLLGDYLLSNLFSMQANKNINFKYFAENGYVVVCKMPQVNMSDKTIDSIMTFLISKIWLSHLTKINNDIISNVIIDEIHRYPTARKLLDNIREMRKYGLKYVFSAHKPSDFKDLLITLKSAGSSYMLFNTSKENLKLFEEELNPFSIEECMNTKKYHAKCIVNYDKQYCVFDAKIIPPILKKSIDRSYIYKECQKKYGVKNNSF